MSNNGSSKTPLLDRIAAEKARQSGKPVGYSTTKDADQAKPDKWFDKRPEDRLPARENGLEQPL